MNGDCSCLRTICMLIIDRVDLVLVVADVVGEQVGVVVCHDVIAVVFGASCSPRKEGCSCARSGGGQGGPWYRRSGWRG